MSSNLLVISGLMLGVLVLVLCTVKFKIHPFFALIATTVTFAIVSGMNLEEMLAAFTSGMGGTMGRSKHRNMTRRINRHRLGFLMIMQARGNTAFTLHP